MRVTMQGADTITKVRARSMTAPKSGVSPDALEAWSKSFLADQDPEIRDAVLGDSWVATFPAGAVITTAAYEDYKVALIHRGQVRSKVTSYDGREVATRYMSVGQIIGLPSLLTAGAAASLEAVSACEVSILNPSTFRRVLRTRVELCYPVAVHLAESTYDAVMHLEENLFGSVQQRVSRHLLEMATPTVNGLVVQTDQTDLANAIGSVREVVSRALRKLSDAGVIRRDRRQIWIEDPRQLRAFASRYPDPANGKPRDREGRAR